METGPDYTTFRLAHSNHEHLHATSTTKFIGPIPHGWFTTHKRSWLRPHTNYHRQSQTFSTEQLNSAGAHDLAQCPRWLAEGDVLLATTEPASTHVSIAEELGPQEASVLSNESSSAIVSNGESNDHIQALNEVQNNRALPIDRNLPGQQNELNGFDGAAVEAPIDRPIMNITSPTSGYSTRESSAVSSASFRTAPETTEEQMRLFASDDSDEDDVDPDEELAEEQAFPDDISEASTIRNHPRTIVPEPGNMIVDHLRHEVPSSETHSFAPRNNSSQMTPSSSDANSRKSLLHRSRGDEDSAAPQANMAHQDPRLVHFADNPFGDSQRTPTQQRHDSACPEGLELDRKTAAVQQRRNNGYFNQRLLRNPFRRTKEPGELLRAERMLLQIESARKANLPDDYSDARAHRIERRTDMHWREFILAARENEEGLIVLSFHRNRSIPVVAKNTTRIKASESIVLDPKTTRANLYSALDKTIVIWQRAKKTRKGTRIFILRPLTTHASIQWYALIQTRLNIKPRPLAIINVPNLNMKVRIDLRNDRADVDDDASSDGESGDGNEAALSVSSMSDTESSASTSTEQSLQVNEHGQVISGGVTITGEYLMSTCWKVLAQSVEWKDVLEDWKRNEKIGLCWRRYDRLEWIHGNHAKALIGQWAMQASHELELRPKVHYATKVKLASGQSMDEPYPVEGFLIRLTSSSGRQARFGKVFYKRLYFSSHDSLLFFSTPSKATPPPPPDFLGRGANDVETLIKEAPLIYDVEPYPLEADSGRIEWLRHGISKDVKWAHNQVAMTENARRVAQLQASDGYIDITKIKTIRRFKLTRSDKANDIGHHGHNIRFHDTGNQDTSVLMSEEDGMTDDIDDDRILELVLVSGLVVRLQAFNAETRDAWMTQLDNLVIYWKRRLWSDSVELQQLRKSNIDALQIDEEIESLVGQYATKWEVSQCVSDPQIYNFCPIASCRTIALRGVLYRKPRINATFRKHECVVSHGQLLIFNHTEYDAGGSVAHKIHHSKTEVLDLQDCYVYSGIAAQNEMIDARDTNDRDGPGRHSLPRLYDDGWTSQDEQEALTFVIWTGRRRRALAGIDQVDSDSKNKRIARLGVAGKSMIYMARSRQERDLWVQRLGTEIERTTGAHR